MLVDLVDAEDGVAVQVGAQEDVHLVAVAGQGTAEIAVGIRHDYGHSLPALLLPLRMLPAGFSMLISRPLSRNRPLG